MKLVFRSSIVRSTILALLLMVPSFASAQTVVNETNIGVDWGFLDEGTTPTVSGFVLGPGIPPLGAGSLNLQTDAATEGVLLGTAIWAGTRLDAFSALSYSTYQNTTPQAISFQFNIDYDDQDASEAYQGRLVFEPANTGDPVLTSAWQTWNMLAANGKWWSTGIPVVNDALAGPTPYPPGSEVTINQLLVTYPNARMMGGTYAGMLLKAGSGWAGSFDGYADNLYLATGVPGLANSTNAPSEAQYDFETTVPVELSQFSID